MEEKRNGSNDINSTTRDPFLMPQFLSSPPFSPLAPALPPTLPPLFLLFPPHLPSLRRWATGRYPRVKIRSRPTESSSPTDGARQSQSGRQTKNRQTNKRLGRQTARHTDWKSDNRQITDRQKIRLRDTQTEKTDRKTDWKLEKQTDTEMTEAKAVKPASRIYLMGSEGHDLGQNQIKTRM